MSRVEVLVATMNQVDLSLFKKMNIQTDVVFCNQCDRNEFIETEINGCRVRMLSTTTRGVGINRNLAMQLSDAEICMCSDDDFVFVDGYEKLICNVFDSVKKADVVGFNIINENGKPVASDKSFFSRRNRFGAVRIAYRNKLIKYNNISFSSMFGGGTVYSSGEDSLFVRDILRSGLKIYQYGEIIGELKKGRDSTWFNGYTDKFFFDKGAWCKAAYPKTWRLLKYHLILVFKDKGEQNIIKKIKLMNQGAKAYKNMQSYKDKYVDNNKE